MIWHLTNIQIKKAKSRDKKYSLAAGNSLFLWITPAGGKHWKYRFRIDGKSGEYSMGAYPEVTLDQARKDAIELKAIVKQGIRPLEQDRRDDQAKKLNQKNTFKAVAESWIDTKGNQWKPNHKQDVERSLSKHIYPHLGKIAVSDINTSDVLHTLRKLESTGSLEMLSKVTQRVRSTFAFACIEGMISINPAADVKSALKSPVSVNFKHVSIDEFHELLRRIDDYDNISGVYPVTQLAMQLLSLIFIRTKELRFLEWSDIDYEKSVIEIPDSRMKMNIHHIVPLSTQALEIIEQLKAYTSDSKYMFCQQNNKHKPMSENAVLYALYRLGYHGRMTGHGFRHIASTQLNEMGYRSDLIEKQLAHGDSNKIRATYNKAQYLPERQKMMQAWSDYIDNLKSGADVVSIFSGKK